MASRPPPNMQMGVPPVKGASTWRLTRENKKIKYQMNVMQQPERARACGAGAKSSADRRPVDPPPVVELRIFESEPGSENETDITFAYNANFFLYATLEAARPVAQGRLPGPPSPPVLTGVPVAGIAYLDRPTAAGYFIFPDLSVRHEGRYVLNFHLYEEVKDPKDADKESSATPNTVSHSGSDKPGSPQAFLNFRLDVKSNPFSVYSAKKFPGLATSTSLSRIIAEQGCRVRIRRDVRMRRRGDKPDESYAYDEGNASVYTRQEPFMTPNSFGHYPMDNRARSNSNGSVSGTPYTTYAPERRPSVPEFANHQNHPNHQSYLHFSGVPMAPMAPGMTPGHPMHTPAHMYSPQQPVYLSYPGAPKYDVFPREYQHQNHYGKPPMPNHYTMEHTKPMTSNYPYQYSAMQQMMPAGLSPGMTPMSGSKNSDFSSEVFDSVETTPAPATAYDQLAGSRKIYSSSESTGTKRTYDQSFGSDDRSLQNFARPETDSYPEYRDFAAESRAALAESGAGMAYKRANGKMVTKIA